MGARNSLEKKQQQQKNNLSFCPFPPGLPSFLSSSMITAALYSDSSHWPVCLLWLASPDEWEVVLGV